MSSESASLREALEGAETLLASLRPWVAAVEDFQRRNPLCIDDGEVGRVGLFNRMQLLANAERCGLSLSKIRSAVGAVINAPGDLGSLAKELRVAFLPGDDQVIDRKLLKAATNLEFGILPALGMEFEQIPVDQAVDSAQTHKERKPLPASRENAYKVFNAVSKLEQFADGAEAEDVYAHVREHGVPKGCGLDDYKLPDKPETFRKYVSEAVSHYKDDENPPSAPHGRSVITRDEQEAAPKERGQKLSPEGMRAKRINDLADVAGDLVIATGKSRQRCWEKVEGILKDLDIGEAAIAKARQADDPEKLAKLADDLRNKAN